MTSKNFQNITATEWIERLKLGEFAVSDFINYSLFSIKKKNRILNAFVNFDEQKIIDQIRRINTKSKYIDSPLLGIPIGVKDIFNTYDFTTEFGSPVYKNYQPGNDARVISSLRRGGAIIAGKTLTSEFAVHYTKGINHPIDKKRIPGSSSAGSAVAVATGMVPVSICSQTAGSTIRPSSYCGIYGFKPSFGLIPRTGVLKTTDTLDTIGLMARSVNDLLLIFFNIHVKGKNYPIVNKNLKKKKINNKIKPRILVFDSFIDSFLTKKVKDKFNQFVKKLVNNDFNIVNYKIDEFFEEIFEHHNKIYCKSLSYYFRSEYKLNKKKFSKILANMIKEGKKMNLTDYKLSLRRQYEISELFDKKFEKFDFIICPSTSGIAPLHGEKDLTDSNLLWTFLGLPVITLPKLRGEMSLPVGISLIGRKYNDYELFEVSKLIDQI